MRTHELKCWPSEYDAIERGEKTFEFRRNDRDFAVGDMLTLRRWDPHTRYYTKDDPKASSMAPGSYPQMRVRVTSILHGGRFGVPDGFCVMSIAKDPAP